MIALIACSASEPPTEYTAQYRLPGSALLLSVELHQSHPFLAEYDRSLVLEGGARKLVEIDLFPDTGGYALVNLYRSASGDYVVRTQGNHYYILTLASGSITPHEDHTGLVTARAAGEEFVGAFDFDAQRGWRFISAAERSERLIVSE